ncbi:multidrug ABC transporter ATP-binding protein [Dolosigranulum pigrum]|jgi:multidrug ABC superfamily ATP binding cassette transporter, ABC protein|uniref:ABC transporter ATP-binding protein n=1 Tax=Dolosigranulum pigrum TaxID=29394 RepID=UPI000DBFE848|nr:ABC transporter ATP-binding protein [Dolosigranulum pigrum]QTJ37984.1 ABC transporter ATP-binding protein [Dolosigranulum pigrum]RAN50823.1 multidrug ABC transporter ATP-binding protein [Dolosigranulum pigrum]
MERKDYQISFSLKENLSIMMRLLQFAQPYWKVFTLSLIAMAVVSGINAYLPIIVQRYIDQYLVNDVFEVGILVRVLLFYAGLTIAKLALTYIKDYLFKNASEQTVANLRRSIYEHVIHLEMRYFDQTPNGSVVSRVTNDTETIKEFWNVFMQVANGLFNAISIAIAMFTLDVKLALIFMAFLPVVIILMYIYQKKSTVIYGRMREALSKVNTELAESITGMMTIQHFNQTDRKKEEFDDVNQEYVDARIKMFKMDAVLLMPAISFIEVVVLVIILLMFGQEYLSGIAVNVGVLYAFTQYAKQFFNPIGEIMNSLSIFQNGIVSGSRVIHLIDKDDLAPHANPGATGEVTAGKIEIIDLTFSYDGENDVLKNINITAEAGETIALVGQTGSGKSSIINLLMRFYEFNRGSIKIDDQSIKEIKDNDLREKMGLVLQDSFMFYGNVRDNITMNGDFTDQEVRKAAEFVNADKIIDNLEDGYQSKVIERGASFSTGEKQLISFARTILRDPTILILDEATANIDTETEMMIQEGLSNMRQGRTTIVIAHRLSTIKEADRIYVLRQGEIIESGTHDELIAQGGMYYDMYQLQTDS